MDVRVGLLRKLSTKELMLLNGGVGELRVPWTARRSNQSTLACLLAKSHQSCPTLSDPMDCSLPGSSVHGIFQARVLEWGAIAFSEMGLDLTVFYQMFIKYGMRLHG